jgi:hypothetical protein
MCPGGYRRPKERGRTGDIELIDGRECVRIFKYEMYEPVFT